MVPYEIKLIPPLHVVSTLNFNVESVTVADFDRNDNKIQSLWVFNLSKYVH